MEPVGSLAWWEARAERMRRRRPRADGLTVERIVDAALALVDAEGLDALTMRRLADELATASASLYRHVASREELLVLVVDHVIGEVVFPASGLDGRREVESLATELRRVLTDHPNLLPALTAAPLAGPNARRGAERALQSLLAAGFAPHVAVPAYLALVDYVLGTVYFDTSRAGRSATDTGGVIGMDRGGDADAAIVRPSPDEVFAFGVSTFLDGLDARRPAGRRTREQRSR